MTALTESNAGTNRPVDAAPRRSRAASSKRYPSLFVRVAGINAALVFAAVALTIAVLAPERVSTLTLDAELGVVLGALLLVVAANVYLLRRVIGPVQALTAFARGVDFANLNQRIPDAEPRSEAGELALTFNEMLSRLERERAESTGRVLGAQEAERLRIAQELHDQAGQELTAVLLRLSRLSSLTPPSLQTDVVEIRDAVRTALQDVRRIAFELRPEALEDLGLAGALAVLRERVAQRLGLKVSEEIAPQLPDLSAEQELVIYRVAQEALTNVARHSASSYAELRLERDHDRLILTVRDYGLGLPRHHAPSTGIQGMQERAALVGATLEIRNCQPGPGSEVRLEVPLGEPG